MSAVAKQTKKKVAPKKRAAAKKAKKATKKAVKKAAKKVPKKIGKKTVAPAVEPPPPPAGAFPPDAPGLPKLGMVCLSSDEVCKFRTITRSGYLKLPEDERDAKLLELYWDNTQRLTWTLGYCARRQIRLYRATSALYPMSDEPQGRAVLESIPAALSAVGRRAKQLGIRVVLHPDQFVVLNSENPQTVETSVKILEKHALWFDLFGLATTPWNLMNVHGGKAGRADELVATVNALPANIKGRLTFENDEYSYGASDILAVCQRTGSPMVFDCHHHVIREDLGSYDHPSLAYFTKAARDTWPDPDWQLCHVSNGETAFLDRYHSKLITAMPKAFAAVPWLEVEARGKELAILGLRKHWPDDGSPQYGTPLRKPTAADLREAADDDL